MAEAMTRRELFVGIAAALSEARLVRGLPTYEELAASESIYERAGMTIFPYLHNSGRIEGYVLVEIMDRSEGLVRYRRCECKQPPYKGIIMAREASEPFHVDPRYLRSVNG